MSSIELEFNNEIVSLKKHKKFYQITSTKDWIFLTKFNTAYLIINIPNSNKKVKTTIDKKFVYNQDYELVCDLNFNYRYIYPLGNFDNELNNIIMPFTGSLNGNNYTIKNINIINSYNNGLFGVVISGSIYDLTIQNIIINDGHNNGVLIGQAFNVEIYNINIIGNILISGENSSCFINILEGNCKNIFICVDGEIDSTIKSIISNEFEGIIDTFNIIINIHDSPSIFNIINGRLKHGNLVTFNYIDKPFYRKTKHHEISNCYYFQLNNKSLPKMQELINCYYRNLTNTITETINTNNWIIINNNYYIKNIINYTNDNLDYSTDISFYDYSSNKSNTFNYYINKNGHFCGKNSQDVFNKNKILLKCNNMKQLLDKENQMYNKIKETYDYNQKIKINHIYQKIFNNNDQNIDNLINFNYFYESEIEYIINSDYIIDEYSNSINNDSIYDNNINNDSIYDNINSIFISENNNSIIKTNNDSINNNNDSINNNNSINDNTLVIKTDNDSIIKTNNDSINDNNNDSIIKTDNNNDSINDNTLIINTENNLVIKTENDSINENDLVIKTDNTLIIKSETDLNSENNSINVSENTFIKKKINIRNMRTKYVKHTI